MSPALANLLNHFGSSLFSYKPSAMDGDNDGIPCENDSRF
nr:excalibur calcium-binding domain-containing protein [Pseudoalteromonas sp. JB197]